MDLPRPDPILKLSNRLLDKRLRGHNLLLITKLKAHTASVRHSGYEFPGELSRSLLAIETVPTEAPLSRACPVPIVFSSADFDQRQGFAAQQKSRTTPSKPTQAHFACVSFYGGCTWETSGSAGFVLFLGLRTRVQLPPR